MITSSRARRACPADLSRYGQSKNLLPISFEDSKRLQRDQKGGALVQLFDNPTAKYTLATRAIPLERIASVKPMRQEPEVGDLVAAEVLSIGKNSRVEIRSGVRRLPGGVFHRCRRRRGECR